MSELPRARILVVEDDPANLRALAEILGDARYDVVSAASGEEALRYLLRQDFAVVLLDVNLPGISGFETAELVRKRRRSQQTPIIFLTGRHPDPSHVFRGYEVGAVDYMVKPIVPEVLKSKVVVFVELYNKGAQIEAQKDELRAAAQRSEQRFYDLVQGLDAVVWEGLPNQELSFVSRRAEDMLGYPLERWTEHRRLRAEIIDPQDREQTLAAYRRAMGERQGVVIEYRVRRADGALAWMRDHVHVVRDAHGRAVHLRGVMVDVTAQKKAETRLQRQTEQLRAADRHRNEFLAMLGHELRNPLAPIQSAVDWLRIQQDTQPGSLATGIETIGRQVDHMSRLVDDLLDVSRITRGKIELRRCRVELRDTLARAIETVTPLLDAKAHHLITTMPEQPLHLDGDPVRLAQVIGNLLHNASKYTPRGGRIEVALERDGSEALIRVRDNGVGISQEMLGRVFELFTQASVSPDVTPGGLGVGLSLVRTLVEMHGGRVRAHSEGAGQGTEVTVWLALEESAAAPPPPLEAAPASAACRILVVDDNEDAGRTFAMLLRAMGHEVRAVADGTAALRTLRSFRPAVVFLDLSMPEMDGYELARRIRARRSSPAPRLVALTGHGNCDAAAGLFDDLVLKPGERRTIEGILAAVGSELAGAG